MGYIVGNMSLKTLTILIIVLIIGSIYSFFSERKRNPTLVIFPMFSLALLSGLAGRICTEYSNNQKLIDIIGTLTIIFTALALLSLFVSVYIAKKKEGKDYSNYRK